MLYLSYRETKIRQFVLIIKLIYVKSLSVVNKYFYRYKHLFLLGVLFVFLSNLFFVFVPQFVREGINIIKNHSTLNDTLERYHIGFIRFDTYEESLVGLAVIILIIALLKGFFQYLTRQTIIVMSRHIEFDMKNDIYQHYQALPTSFYKTNRTGDIITRISEDVSQVRMYIGPAIMYGWNLLTLFPITVAVMFSVNSELTLYTLAPLPFLSIGIYLVSSKMNKQSDKIQSRLSSISTFVQETFSGIRTIKTFAKENDRINHFDAASEKYKTEALKLTKIEALFMPLIQSLIGASTIITVYIGSKFVAEGSIDVGNIAEFIMYVNMLTWPVTSVGWVTSIVQRAAASQTRINEFLKQDNNLVSVDNQSLADIKSIQFKNLSFTYPDSGIEALKNVSFEIHKGETIAVIGNTGSGKSTIATLLCRLYDTTSGEILVNNQSIKSYNVQSLRSNLGYVPQDAFLFSDTIENNIAFGAVDVSKEDIIEATKMADVYDNIVQFPEQFQTKIGERGITLSGGQKQRTTIARAIIRNPKLLILDDSLSAVDTKTEDTILQNLQKVMKDRTSIIISHRVSSVKLADKIIVLDEGKLVETGSHNELIKLNGLYKEIYEDQADNKN